MRKFIGSKTAAALLVASSPVSLASADDASPTMISTATGPVEGVSEGAVVSFKGIPFAQPPIGDLRWRAPQPIEPWADVFQADSYANDCMQVPFAADAAPLGTPPAEDCLYLNVWKPADATPADPRPVIVWIYGGGWVNGGSSPAVYSGAPLASEGVVFVSFNYRLNRFGFFAHPALTEADEDDGLLGNYGYMDQIAALKWVQENVAAFGGDPDNVTIIGESAGGSAVVNLMTSPMAEGLFHRAVAMSAPARMDMIRKPVSSDTAPDGEDDGVLFAEWAGVDAEGAEALAALRALPAELLAKDTTMMAQPEAPLSGPMVDGLVMPNATKALHEGKVATVPTMVGAVSEDIGFGPEVGEDELFATFPDADEARAAYNDFVGDPATLLRYVYADAMMIEPARFVAQAVTKVDAPAYHYRYGYVAESMRDEWIGTPHATEIPFFLNTLDARYGEDKTEIDQAAADVISSYLLNFARTGDPNGEGLPEWPVYDDTSRNLMNITFDSTSAGDDPWRARLDATQAAADRWLTPKDGETEE